MLNRGLPDPGTPRPVAVLSPPGRRSCCSGSRGRLRTLHVCAILGLTAGLAGLDALLTFPRVNGATVFHRYGGPTAEDSHVCVPSTAQTRLLARSGGT